MKLTIHPVHPTIGAEVEGVDLRRPLDDETVSAVKAAIDRHAVLVFRGQPLDDAAQLAFTERLGPLEPTAGGDVTRAEDRRLASAFADVSNLDRDQQVFARDDRRRLFGLANRLWHSDSSYRAVPAKYSLLSARSVASRGGNTEFADMRAAYDALDDAAREEIADLVCEHSLMHSRGLLGFTEFSAEERAAFAPVLQRLVRTHPRTGRRSLYLSSHAGGIVGWPVPEARMLLRDLNEHATAARFVHAHRWRLHDLVIWDNRVTMHRVRRFDDTREQRDMRRTTVAGDAPTVTLAA